MAKSHDYGLAKGNRNNGGYGSNNWGGQNNRGAYQSGGRNQGKAASYNNRKPVGGYQRQYDIPPTAPYNFVKLNEHVVEAPLAEKMAFLSDESGKSAAFMDFITSEGKYSGYFDVTIKNIAPLYIGSEDGFFSDGHNYFIPGSSLRGCLKNTFKMITCSSFRSDKDNQDISDRHLYFRSFGAYKEFRELYSDRMISSGQVGQKDSSVAKCGLLVKDREGYHIVPCKKELKDVSIRGHYFDWSTKYGDYFDNKEIVVYIGLSPTIGSDNGVRGNAGIIWHKDYVDVFTGTMENKKNFYRLQDFDMKTLLSVNDKIIEDYKADKPRGKFSLFDDNNRVKGKDLPKATFIQNYDNKNVYNNIVVLPYFKTKDKNDVIKLEKYKQFYEVDEKKTAENERNGNKKIVYKNTLLPEVLDKLKDEIEKERKRFLDDCEATTRVDLFADVYKYDYVIPCFYTLENGNVTGIGASPFFRIPYRKAISDHIPAELKGDTIDFTDAVFGNKGDWASRVYFEDLFLATDAAPEFEVPELHKVLSGANPTSFQMYLETKEGKAAMWDDEGNLRGYKLYWHKDEDWRAEPDVKKQMTTEIAPLKKGHTFTGRIRFENLDKIELGAMCALFTLGKENGICYKLGSGKPIGLGTVKIKAKLVLQGDDYYTRLFEDNGFALSRSSASLEDFKKPFDDYMEAKLSEKGGKEHALYEERMQELRLIMSTGNMQKPEWNNQTRYMSINDRNDKDIYAKRTPLPSITEVYNKAGKGK